MEEILSKRIILLTNAVIVLSMLGFLALIHRVDAIYKEKEYSALTKLRNCVESIPKDAGTVDVSVPAARKWMLQHDHEAFLRNLVFADSLAHQLKRNGFGDDLQRMKGNGQASASEVHTISVTSADTGSCCEHGFGDLDGTHKLQHFIEQYNYLQTPVIIRMAVSVEKDAVTKAIKDFNKQQEALAKNSGDPDFYTTIGDQSVANYVRIENDTCRIGFRNTTGMYQDAGTIELAIPVKTEKVPGPTWMDLFAIDADYKGLAKKVELQKIVRHYGDLPMERAIEMIGDDYMDAYENVDIFGFSFSTTSLPLALLAFFTFLSSGLFLMVREGYRKGLKVFSGYENEEITDFFVKRPFIRIILWMVLPIASLVATLPVLPVENEKLIVLGTGSVVIGVLNFLSLRMAKKL